MRSRSALAAVTALIMLLAVLAAPTHAALSVTAQPSSPAPGDTVTVIVTGASPGASVGFEVKLNGQTIWVDEAVADSTGTATTSFKIPETAEPGSTLTIYVAASKPGEATTTAELSLTVAAPTTTTTTTTATTTTTTTTPAPAAITPVPIATPTAAPTTPTTTTVPPVTPGVLEAVEVKPGVYIANISAFVEPLTGEVRVSVTVRLPTGDEVVIPAGTRILVEGRPAKSITVKVVKELPPEAEEALKKREAEAVSRVYDLGPSGAELSKPVRLVFKFDVAKCEGKVVRVCYYDPALRDWVPVDKYEIDFARGVAVGYTTHFTLFATVAVTEPLPSPPATTTTTTATATATTTVPATETTATPPATTPAPTAATPTATASPTPTTTATPTTTPAATPSPAPSPSHAPQPQAMWLWVAVAAAAIIAVAAAAIAARRK